MESRDHEGRCGPDVIQSRSHPEPAAMTMSLGDVTSRYGQERNGYLQGAMGSSALPWTREEHPRAPRPQAASGPSHGRATIPGQRALLGTSSTRGPTHRGSFPPEAGSESEAETSVPLSEDKPQRVMPEREFKEGAVGREAPAVPMWDGQGDPGRAARVRRHCLGALHRSVRRTAEEEDGLSEVFSAAQYIPSDQGTGTRGTFRAGTREYDSDGDSIPDLIAFNPEGNSREAEPDWVRIGAPISFLGLAVEVGASEVAPPPLQEVRTTSGPGGWNAEHLRTRPEMVLIFDDFDRAQIAAGARGGDITGARRGNEESLARHNRLMHLNCPRTLNIDLQMRAIFRPPANVWDSGRHIPFVTGPRPPPGSPAVYDAARLGTGTHEVLPRSYWAFCRREAISIRAQEMAIRRGWDVTLVDGYEGRYREDAARRLGERTEAARAMGSSSCSSSSSSASGATGGIGWAGAGPDLRDSRGLFRPTIREGDARERDIHGRLEEGIIHTGGWGGFRDTTRRRPEGAPPRPPTRTQLREDRRDLREARQEDLRRALASGEVASTGGEARHTKRARREAEGSPAPRDMLTRSRSLAAARSPAEDKSGSDGAGYVPRRARPPPVDKEEDEDVDEKETGSRVREDRPGR
jgi:hypothetical protein